MINFAVPGDTRIEDEGREKIDKYRDIVKELQKNLECYNSAYTLKCRFITCYNQTVWEKPKKYWYHGTYKTVAEDSFIRQR